MMRAGGYERIITMIDLMMLGLAVSLRRYGAGILKWMKSKLDKINRQTRKFKTMNKGLQPGNDVGSLYVSRMDGESGLIGCKT